MPKGSAKPRPQPKLVAKLKLPVPVRVLEPTAEPLASLKMLDVERLRKGNHTIEVGFLHGGCCPKLVRAVIQHGMVTRLDTEPCKDSERAPSKEIVQLFEQVRRRIKAPRPWEPMPVEDFIKQAIARPTIWGTGAGCIYICILEWCLFCCLRNRTIVCWIETRTATP
jgi:hypothetical protein